MTGWTGEAQRAIAEVHAALPADIDLKARAAAVDAAYPFSGRSHWPYKAWLKARKAYLAKFGYKAKGAGPLFETRAAFGRLQDVVADLRKEADDRDDG